MITSIRVEPANDSRHDAADGAWRTVWGYVFSENGPRAVYYVRWNDTALREAEFVVSVGEWGEGSGPHERSCTVLVGQKYEGRLALMLVDAAFSSFADQSFLGAMKGAEEVRGSELAREVFRILDEVLVQDERVAQLRARIEA